MKSLTVISPVYNEEQIIESFYLELSRVLASLADHYNATILFVVDRCTDGTLQILERIANENSLVRILVLSSRFGHQMSLLAGIDHAYSDVLIMMDSDMQHPPGLIPALLDSYEEGYDIVYTVRDDGNDIGLLKRVSSKLFYRFINILSQIPILESAADFRLISRRVAEVFQTQIRERNQFLRGLFVWVGFRSTGIPFRCGGRLAGRSKYSWGRLVQFAIHGVISFSKRPLQGAVYLGFVIAFIGFALALATFIQYFTHRSWPPGWATIAILIPIFSGVQLIFLGVLGEYIAAIFDEVKARPHYIIEKRVNFGD